MQETEFSVFASKLATYFQGESSPEEFTRTLFEKIYFNSKGDTLLHDMEKRTLRGYFYHENDITYLAKKISGDLDSGYFEEFIDTEMDDTVKGLCAEFAEECPGIDEANFKQKISERFKQIIRNAAAPKRRTKKKKLTLSSADEAAVATIQPSIKEKYGALLVAEERSVCPNDGCCAPLFVNVGGEVGASQRIEDGIRRVLEKIPEISPTEDVDLNYDPVELRQKISKDNLMLYLKVKTNVNMYNSAVEEVFLELNEERILRFRPFCTQVKLMYLNFADKDWSQDKIFEKMVDWLQNATNENRISCEVIISYFIRKCEVFDAITE